MDSQVARGFTILGSSILSIASGLIGSIAHVSPTFTFNDLRLLDYFGTMNDLIWIVSSSYAAEALTQAYKVINHSQDSTP